MTEAQLIHRWKLCEQIANEIGMNIGTNSETFFAQGKPGKGNFHGYYAADNVGELLGFLNGVREAKRVLTKT